MPFNHRLNNLKLVLLEDLRTEPLVNEDAILNLIKVERKVEIEKMKDENDYNHTSIDLRRNGKCKSCNNEAEELHTCPFEEEIYDDTTMCNCCYECESNCCSEI